MKIKKQYNLKEGKLQKLTEAEDQTAIDNLDTASVEDIADTIIAGVEKASEEKLTVDASVAEETAKEIKSISDDADFKALASLGVDNELTRILDKALANTNKHRRMGARLPNGLKTNNNVLIIGLPGSSKTAIAQEWCDRNGLNLFYIDAKDDDLKAILNGFPVRGEDDEFGNPTIVRGYSKELNPLDRPNSVLFLDELNRQLSKPIRATLLSLINEKRVPGTGKNGFREFPNLLFTIACINPPTEAEEGADRLDQAERSRFSRTVKLDSDASVSRGYFINEFLRRVASLMLSPKDSYFKSDLDEFIKSLGIALHLLDNPTFTYSTVKDMPALAREDRNMFNQRMLTDGLNASGGDVQEFRDWYNSDADFLKSTIDMLNDIMDSYNEVRGMEEAKKQLKIAAKKKADPSTPAKYRISEKTAARIIAVLEGKDTEDTTAASLSTEPEAGLEDDGFEDDEDLFSTAAAKDKTRMDSASIKQKLAGIDTAWGD